ncbi:MAG: leucine-rich repeat protein [Clostridium sp.]|nr:leucine-rich repeat protein [Clostridium sp.]
MARCTKCMVNLEAGIRICPHCGYEQDSGAQPLNALKRHTILRGRYYIGNVIGQGGFGITYVGWDTTLEMKVAVKEYFPSGSASRTNSYSNEIQWDFAGDGEGNWPDGMERFLKEARKMAKLEAAPAVVRVRDAFGENQTAYIVMDFIEGDTLKNYLLAHGVLRYEACIKLLSPILDSLAVIHDCGFIHRDISPDNIMLQPDGKARLLDMGAAVDVRANGGRASMAVVKRNFSAPEQYMELECLGSWTDVYAMAATIYYCITGHVVPEAMEREFKKTPVSFDPELNIPAHVAETLRDALELNAENRIRDMRELKRRISMAGEPPATRPASQPIPPVTPSMEKTAPPHSDADTVRRDGRPKGKKRAKGAFIAAGALSALFVAACVFFVIRPDSGAAAPGVRADVAAEAGRETFESSGDDMANLSEWAYKETEDGGGMILTEYTADHEASHMKLPGEINGLPVVELGERLFYENQVLEEVVLPAGLKTIGDYTFSRCSNLKRIDLPEGLREIGEYAFFESGITELTLPSTVEAVDGAILYNTQVKIAEGNSAFTMADGILYKNGSQLAAFPNSREGKFSIPPEIESIGDHAFAYTSLTEVAILKGVRIVGRGAFEHSAQLERVVFDEGVKELGDFSFDGCTSLQTINISRSVKKIGYHAVYDCGRLYFVTISKDCQFDENAFGEDITVWYYEDFDHVRLS